MQLQLEIHCVRHFNYVHQSEPRSAKIIIGVGKKMFIELRKGLVRFGRKSTFHERFLNALIAIHSSLCADWSFTIHIFGNFTVLKTQEEEKTF